MKGSTPNEIAHFVFFRILVCSSAFLSSRLTLAKCKAAILKSSALAIITSRKVITARYNAILDQSERTLFHSHRSS